MQKIQRQTAILKLISGKSIGTQEELTAWLEKKGFPVTQSSVSRDLVELGVVKVNGFYAFPQKPKNAISAGLLTVQAAGENLIVARTEPGLASAIAVRIDDARISEIVGTIAGDDTIFVAVKNAKSQKSVVKKIWEIFER